MPSHSFIDQQTATRSRTAINYRTGSAVNLFEFGEEWRFAFATNEDLPRTPYTSYTEEQREHLIKGTMDITLPLDEPFYGEPWTPLEETIAKR